MKKKYIVNEMHGLWFKGKLYLQGSEIELTDEQFKELTEPDPVTKAVSLKLEKVEATDE